MTQGRARSNGTAGMEACGVWAVLNVTPDSFSDGGLHLHPDAAVAFGRRALREGATVVDVGGESSRPAGKTYGQGFVPVAEAEEIRRVVPVVRALSSEGATVSIDTVKPGVARAALEAGARIVNDVSGGGSSALLEEVAAAGAELVLMHNRGAGEVAGDNVEYGDVVEDVRRELLAAVARAVAVGVPAGRIWLDPGIGFAKTAAQSLALLAAIDRLVDTGHRVLVGPSRKSFITLLSGPAEPDERVGGTAAAVTIAVLGGAHAVRVHDVAIMAQAVRIAEHARARRPS